MAGSSHRGKSRLLAWYVLAGVLVPATWTQLDAIGVRALLPLALAFAIERWPSFWHASLAKSQWWMRVRRQPFPGRPRAGQIAIGVMVSLPLVFHLVATLGEEFPYGGDEGYHFSATRTYALYLRSAAPWLAALALALGVLRVVHARWVATVAVAALWALSFRFGSEVTFARYPAAFYLLAAPLNVFGELLRISNPHISNHVMNTLSVPMWLFVLRPIVVRRWPDLGALAAGLLLFYQPTIVTFFGGGGLEPWSLILLLVALEAAVRLPAEDRWVAVLLAGSAAWIKEPAILFLPVVWAITMVEWRGIVPALRTGAIPLGIVAAVPFIVYYFVRHTLDIHRFYQVAPLAELASRARVGEWFERMHQQFGDSGLILLALLPVFAVAASYIHRRSGAYLHAHVLMVLFAIALVVIFYIDALGVPYTGYGRYLMFPYGAIAIALLLFVDRLVEGGRSALAVAVIVLIVVCQARPLAATLALDFSPDYERNSLEWHRCLIRLPFRQFAQEISTSADGAGIKSIRLVTISLDAQITRVAYPDVAARYTIVPTDLQPGQVDCSCKDATEALVVGFEYRANFDAPIPNDPRVAAAEVACMRQLEASCRRVTVERAASSATVAALGIGVR